MPEPPFISDPHAPTQIRAVNPKCNVDAWYAARTIDPTQEQYRARADRVRIW